MRRVVVVLSICLFLYGTSIGQDPRENFKFAKFKYDNGDFKEALKFLDLALAEDSLYVSAHFLRAETHYQLKQYYNAVLDINHILKIEQDKGALLPEYYLARAKSFLALNDYNNAQIDLEKALTVSDNNAECYYLLAKLEIARENYTDALTALDASVKRDPGQSDYYLLRAETKNMYQKPLKGSTDYYNIMNDFDKAVELNPNDFQTYLARSNFLNQMGEKERALADYNKVIDLSPKKEQAYSKRGVIKMNNYDYRSAMLDFTKSILINPNEESNYRYRGLCYNNLNNYDEAFKDFSKSIDLLSAQLEESAEKDMKKNTLAETYILRGHCLNLMGNNAQACRDFLAAHNLGVKKGLNYYRKYCGIY